jgi:DNA-binding transcriptional regulator GbsR (MarR family)
VEAPQALTQTGIAEAIDIRVTHVPRSVKKLDEDGLIYESVMHIKGLDKRRKAYFLTEKGMYQANDIKRILKERRIPFKDLNGKVKDIQIQKIEETTGIRIDILDLLRLIDREGILNQKSMESFVNEKTNDTPESPKRLFDFPHKVAKTKKFIGRKEELKNLLNWFDDPEIILIYIKGDAGIGKTSILGKALLDMKDEKNVFWFDFAKGDGFEDMMENLSDFLARLNRTKLKAMLKGKKIGHREIMKCFNVSASETDAHFVFDSLNEADSESKKFLSMLHEEINELSGFKIFILHRPKERIHTKKRADSDAFRTMELKGLDKKSARLLIGKKKMDSDDFQRIYTLTEGNPLALKLIKSEDVSDLVKTGKFTKDELTLIKYLKSIDKI